MDAQETAEHLGKFINQVQDTLEAIAERRFSAITNQARALRLLCAAAHHTRSDKELCVQMAETLERLIWQTERAINNLQRNTAQMKSLTTAGTAWEICQEENWVDWRICETEKKEES